MTISLERVQQVARQTGFNMVFPLPRLSVDIDLNLVEPLSREELQAIRPRFEQAFEAVFRREGFTIRKSPTEHAGGKWRLGYPSAVGGPSNLEVDVNYVLRRPLWEPEGRETIFRSPHNIAHPPDAFSKLSLLRGRR